MTPATAAASPVELDITHMLHREILAARLSTEHGRLPPMVQTIADFINDGPFLGVYVFVRRQPTALDVTHITWL